MEWKTKQITHEGLPLMLRYPENLDFDLLKSRFTKLVLLKHQFSKATSNGLPEANYNDALFQFDQQIRDAFEISRHGVTVLIETFAGKRNYYFYADSKEAVTKIMSSLRFDFPQEILSWTIHSDAEWSFIAKYSKEFLSE